MPFQDDYAFMSAGIPVLYPASIGEFLSSACTRSRCRASAAAGWR